MDPLIVALLVLVVLLAGGAALLVPKVRRRQPPLPPAPPAQPAPPAAEPDLLAPPAPEQVTAPPEERAPPVEPGPEPTAGRLVRLRARLARSESALGRGLLALLARDRLDESAWEEVEEILIGADVGVAATTELVERLRARSAVLGTRTTDELRAI